MKPSDISRPLMAKGAAAPHSRALPMGGEEAAVTSTKQGQVRVLAMPGLNLGGALV